MYEETLTSRTRRPQGAFSHDRHKGGPIPHNEKYRGRQQWQAESRETTEVQ